MNRVSASLLLVLVAATLLAGCATPPERAYFEVLETRPATRALTSADAMPDTMETNRFLLIEKGVVGGELVETTSVADRFQAEWKVVEGERREQFYSRDDDGDVVLRAVIEHSDKAISIFTPPLKTIYAVLEPNEPRTQEVAMRVVQQDDPRKQREAGTATQIIEYREDCRIRIGDREYDTARIDTTFDADLRLADVHQTAATYLVRGRGVVAEQTEKTVKILGVIGNTERQLRVIAPDERQ